MRLKISKDRLLFVLLPVIVAIWPLWLAFVSLPRVERGWIDDDKKVTAARDNVRSIIRIDPDRLAAIDASGKPEKFEYPVAVNKIASMCNISPASYKITVMPDVKPASGQASQNAVVSIDKVSIKTATEFVALGETRYNPNLKCTQFTLKKIRDQKDLWDLDLTFTHYE
jgi:hypothetical protein